MPLFCYLQLVPIKVHIMADKQLSPVERIMTDEKPVITLKLARRVLGKKVSSSIDDADLSRIIQAMSTLAMDLECKESVPKSGMV